MVILVRYFLREYLKILGLCLTTLVVIYLAVDFFEKIRRFVKYDVTIVAMLSFFVLRIPQAFMDMMPIAALMSVLLTLGMLSRHNEITAVKSCGISIARLASPFLIFSFLISTIVLTANLSIIPLSKQRTDYVREVLIEKRHPDIYFRQSRIWLRVGQRAFMNIQVVDGKNAALFGVNLYKLHEDFSLSELLEAKRIRYERGTWVLYDGIRRTFLQDGRIKIEHLDQAVIPLNRQPDEFIRIEKDTDKMTYHDLAQYVEKLEQEGYDAERYRVDLNSKMALPFMSFVFGFIGIPLSLGGVLGRGISRGIGLSLIIAAAYFLIYSLSISLGHGNILDPFLSAWLPNILFTMAGLILMMGVKQ